jgi:hypothetical protein
LVFVKFGDFDALPTFTCDDGTKEEGVWRAEAAGNDHVSVIQSGIKKKSSVITGTKDVSYIIDSAGTIISFKVVILTENGITLTLVSK